MARKPITLHLEERVVRRYYDVVNAEWPRETRNSIFEQALNLWITKAEAKRGTAYHFSPAGAPIKPVPSGRPTLRDR